MEAAEGVEAAVVAEAEEKFPADLVDRWCGSKALMLLGNDGFRFSVSFSWNCRFPLIL